MSNMGKRYTKEYKLEAVRLAEKIGVYKAATELGVSAKSITSWSRGESLGDSVKSQGSNKPASHSELEAEVRRLKKEVKNLKIINDVLKKSTAIFSKDQIGD